MPSFVYQAHTLEKQLALYSSLFPAGGAHTVRAAVIQSRQRWKNRRKRLQKLGLLKPPSENVAYALRHCWPCGIGWNSNEPLYPVDICPAHYRFCGYSRFCPFCYGRASTKRGMAILDLISSICLEKGEAFAYILDHKYVHPRIPRRRDVSGFIKKAHHPYLSSLKKKKIASAVRGIAWRNSFQIRREEKGPTTFHVRHRQLLLTAEPLPAMPAWTGSRYESVEPGEAYRFPGPKTEFSVATRFLRYDVGLLKGKTEDLAWVIENCPSPWFGLQGELREATCLEADAETFAADEVESDFISKNDEVQV